MPFAKSKKITIPGRTSEVCQAKVNNSDLGMGHVPRLDFREGVYAGEAIVTNNQGKAYFKIFNTKETDVVIKTPCITIKEFETGDAKPLSPLTEDKAATESSQVPRLRPAGDNVNKPAVISQKPKQRVAGRNEYAISHSPPSLNPSRSCKHIDWTHERYELALRNVNLDGLNSEEKFVDEEMIKEFTDLFHLPGDRLTYSDTVMHKIETVDSIPVNVRQYRFPPIHKEEINWQIGELLENEVIKPSTSPYNSPLWIVP